MKSTDALDSIGGRVNLTIAHATSVTLADNRGHEPMEVFGMIPASVIPRVFWPGKPIMQPGAMQTARILGGNILVSEIRSATAAGFATELYLGGWWFGVGAPGGGPVDRPLLDAHGWSRTLSFAALPSG